MLDEQPSDNTQFFQFLLQYINDSPPPSKEKQPKERKAYDAFIANSQKNTQLLMNEVNENRITREQLEDTVVYTTWEQDTTLIDQAYLLKWMRVSKTTVCEEIVENTLQSLQQSLQQEYDENDVNQFKNISFEFALNFLIQHGPWYAFDHTKQFEEKIIQNVLDKEINKGTEYNKGNEYNKQINSLVASVKDSFNAPMTMEDKIERKRKTKTNSKSRKQSDVSEVRRKRASLTRKKIQQKQKQHVLPSVVLQQRRNKRIENLIENAQNEYGDDDDWQENGQKENYICPPGKELNQKTGYCVIKCDADQERNEVSGRCINKCFDGYYRTLSGRCKKKR